MNEPTTALTDFVLAAELFLFSYLTIRADTEQWSVLFWAIALALLGLSALAGGFYHGYAPTPAVWRIVSVAIVATLGFMVAAGIVSSTEGNTHLVWLLLTEVPILILIVRLLAQEQASLQVNNSRKWILIITSFLVILLHVQIYIGGPAVGNWLLAGSIIILFGIWIQQSGYSLHKHFNHNDLCHIIFMIGMYFLYRTGLLLRDR